MQGPGSIGGRWGTVALAAALGTSVGAATADAAAATVPVYRCAGNVYQSEPCPGGERVDIDPDRNVVEAERRRPAPPPAAESRDRPDVVVIEREPAPQSPVIVREPVYVWPQHVRPRLHAPPPGEHRRHPRADRPPPRTPENVGRPAYGFRPDDQKR